MNRKKFLRRLLQSQTNVRFEDLTGLVKALGFRLSRVTGSHHIFIHPAIAPQLNLQDVNGEAKPYQIKQLLKLIEQYDLKLEEES